MKKSRALYAAAVSAAVALLPPNPCHSTPPRPPATMVMEEGQPQFDAARKEIPVKLRVRVHEELSALQITATSTLIDPAKPAFAQRGKETMFEQKLDLAKEREPVVTVPVRLPGAGRYEFDVRLKGTTKDGSGFSDRLIRYITIDEKGEFRILTGERDSVARQQSDLARFEEALRRDPKHPRARLLSGDTATVPRELAQKAREWEVAANKQLLVRPGRPSELLRKYTVDRSAESWAATDPLTIRGRVMFVDIDGAWRPLVNVAVHLWDEDTFGDEYLGSVATGWDGRWSFSVNNDDGIFADGRDIYYTFELENTRWRVKSSGGNAYSWKSAVHDDLSDGTVLDFGEETGVQNPNSMQIWSVLNLAWNHITTVGGLDPGFVDAVFPGSGTFFDGAVNVEASDNDSPDSITHEYGHALMDIAYAGEGGDPSPGGDHGFNDCGQNRTLSWSEGWATGFMLSVRPDGVYNWHEGDDGRQIERFSSTCRTGESSEGWVAASLVDLMDSGNDDNGGNENRGRNGHSDTNSGARVSLATIFRDTMNGSFHSDFLTFWSSLAGELSGPTRDNAAHIIYYNWMSVLEPGSCVSTKIATRELKDADSILTGLRAFRNEALKKTDAGRELINIHNRNSAELAAILLRDEKLRADCLAVMQHFARFGDAITHHARYTQLIEKPEPVLPPEMSQLIESVIARLEAAGSQELKQDLRKVRQSSARVAGRTLEELQTEMAGDAKRTERPAKRALNPESLNPASVKALRSRRLREFIKQQFPTPPPAQQPGQSPSPAPGMKSESADPEEKEDPEPAATPMQTEPGNGLQE